MQPQKISFLDFHFADVIYVTSELLHKLETASKTLLRFYIEYYIIISKRNYCEQG